MSIGTAPKLTITDLACEIGKHLNTEQVCQLIAALANEQLDSSVDARLIRHFKATLAPWERANQVDLSPEEIIVDDKQDILNEAFGRLLDN